MTDPREVRLPKWAQEELASLRREVARQTRRADEARLATLPEESNTVLDRYERIPIGLGVSPTVRFKVGPDRSDWLEARWSANGVEVSGGYQIAVRPISGNVVRVLMIRD